jgi:regulator of sigma E protease
MLRTDAVVAASLNTANPKGYLGISPSQYSLQRFSWSAPIVALGLMVQFTALTFHGLGTAVASLFSGHTTKAAAQVTGPVGIFEILKSGTLLGYQFILMIIAIISLSLAIMNVLPIPALDGGKLFVTLIARAVNKQISERAENIIYGTGFAVLFALIILITIVDVKRI